MQAQLARQCDQVGPLQGVQQENSSGGERVQEAVFCSRREPQMPEPKLCEGTGKGKRARTRTWRENQEQCTLTLTHRLI